MLETGRRRCGGCAGTVLFLAVFLFSWITLGPFVDLSGEAVLDQSAWASSALNQLLSLGLFARMLGFGLLHPMRCIILQPRVLLESLIFASLGFVSVVLSSYPFRGIKGMVLAVISVVNASVFLLSPRCERHFAKLLGTGCLIVLSLAYYGVLSKPTLSIHQASQRWNRSMPACGVVISGTRTTPPWPWWSWRCSASSS